MNTMVAARVPSEVKEQGDGILRSLGSSPTELINKAYAYVLKYGALPGDAGQEDRPTTVRRQVTSEMMASLHVAYEEMSLPLSDAWGTKSFKDIRSEIEDDRYARFA